MSDEQVEPEPWYGVRCVIRSSVDAAKGWLYEERITLWRASSFEEAIEKAEHEAHEYASDTDGEYVHLAQAFHLAVGDEVGDGAEVFSLMRESELEADEYLTHYFDTGDERQGTME